MKDPWFMPIKKAKKKVKKVKVAFSKAREQATQKTTINKELAKHGRRDGTAIVLDGPGIKTTKELIKAGWRTNQIYIPNNSPDFTPIKRKHSNTYHVSLNEYLKQGRVEQSSIGLLYADYMCSQKGNKDCTPIEDIGGAFENRLFKDGAVLGVTICSRSSIKNTSGFTHHSIQTLISEICDTAFKYGYTTLLLPVGGIYGNGGSTMWTGLFTILKA